MPPELSYVDRSWADATWPGLRHEVVGYESGPDGGSAANVNQSCLLLMRDADWRHMRTSSCLPCGQRLGVAQPLSHDHGTHEERGDSCRR